MEKEDEGKRGYLEMEEIAESWRKNDDQHWLEEERETNTAWRRR